MFSCQHLTVLQRCTVALQVVVGVTSQADGVAAWECAGIGFARSIAGT
jgi:hypothetical protein